MEKAVTIQSGTEMDKEGSVPSAAEQIQKACEYPFDSELLLAKSKRIRRALLADGSVRMKRRIAMLGGSTTHDILRILELFLLHYGIEPVFYESEYAQYWQDAMFPEQELLDFAPELILVHTTARNLPELPRIEDTPEDIAAKYEADLAHFRVMWDALRERFHCPVIQNNFAYPSERLLGNRDAVDPHGRIHFLNRLNTAFAEEAARREELHLCDICYLAARVGLDRWNDARYWNMYKYEPAVPVIPELSFQYANLIKAIYGRNKKALALDLDNTLWGGVVGDDGPEGIELGEETGPGQAYRDFQRYLRAQKELGVMLTVDSKNDEANALAGLAHPDGILRAEDMVCIRANWEPKSQNLREIAGELNILPEAIVFVDDNPAERALVKGELPEVSAPDIGEPEDYIRVLDHAGYFENITLSEDDLRRSDMMRDNVRRREAQSRFADYGAYLRSLAMRAEIRPFEELYFPRIAQLTNKSNQFNVTTRRYTQEEIAGAAGDPGRITLCGRLLDRFGDNGIVSLAIGRLEDAAVHIELFLMSCRVLKRDMELAMLDALAAEALRRGARELVGYYCPTPKNHMVEHLYESFGFRLCSEDQKGCTVWRLSLTEPWERRNRYIEVIS